MPVYINEKQVLPGSAFERSRLDAQEIDGMLGERLQRMVEGPDFVAHRGQERSFVMSTRLSWLWCATERGKPGKVGSLILDILCQDVELIVLCCETAGDSGSLQIGCGLFRGARV